MTHTNHSSLFLPLFCQKFFSPWVKSLRCQIIYLISATKQNKTISSKRNSVKQTLNYKCQTCQLAVWPLPSHSPSVSLSSASLWTLSFAVAWRRQWQHTPVFLPGESQGWWSLVACRLWGCTESDTTEATWQQQQHNFKHVVFILMFWFSIFKDPVLFNILFWRQRMIYPGFTHSLLPISTAL